MKQAYKRYNDGNFGIQIKVAKHYWKNPFSQPSATQALPTKPSRPSTPSEEAEASLCGCLPDIFNIIRNAINKLRGTQSGQQELFNLHIRRRALAMPKKDKGKQKDEKTLKRIQKTDVNERGAIFKSEDAKLVLDPLQVSQDFVFSGTDNGINLSSNHCLKQRQSRLKMLILQVEISITDMSWR
ncbi:hypothetical protein EDC96DRAFT_525144 [Choanephora cucurbitarum]|nr:hypothetical protein EDC96DRAFT_525144 [Choanephora cucurbitarum]